MRKCDSCGYLLLGEGDACKHCGAALTPVAVGAPTIATPAAAAAPPPPAPAATSAPPAPGLWSERARPPGPSFAAPPPPVTARPQNPWGPPVEPVIRTVPAKKSNGGIVLALVVALVCGAAGYWFVTHRSNVPAGAGDFVAGKGVEYVASDGSYSVKFPEAPLVQSQPIKVESFSSTVTIASVTTDDYEIGTASMALPINVPPSQADAVLDDAMKGGLDAADGDLVSQKHITRGGLPALEATFKASDGYTAHALVMSGGNRLYMLFVHARKGTEALYHALDKSFIPSLSM